VKVEPRSSTAIAAGMSSYPDLSQKMHHQSFDVARGVPEDEDQAIREQLFLALQIGLHELWSDSIILLDQVPIELDDHATRQRSAQRIGQFRIDAVRNRGRVQNRSAH
jgi:hypothetical protein